MTGFCVRCKADRRIVAPVPLRWNGVAGHEGRCTQCDGWVWSKAGRVEHKAAPGDDEPSDAELADFERREWLRLYRELVAGSSGVDSHHRPLARAHLAGVQGKLAALGLGYTSWDGSPAELVFHLTAEAEAMR